MKSCEKNALEFTQWLLRAGEREYVAVQDEDSENIFLISKRKGLNAFEVKFEF